MGLFDKLLGKGSRDEGLVIYAPMDGEAVSISQVNDPTFSEEILGKFKSGEIKVVANVGVLTTGFDYPELDTIVLARPTMSLSLYYQMVGRAIRPHKDKPEAWVVDLCNNYWRFGRVEDLKLTEPQKGMYQIESKGKRLTNVYF